MSSNRQTDMAPTPISVLHFTNATARAGAEEHILTLLRGLDRRQFRLRQPVRQSRSGLEGYLRIFVAAVEQTGHV